ncbi:XRE family transcriptional regulator [Candidatus Borkfalkia ceftriaxoniphila]|uniref:XRE family transcriptional regulator n=1 Tax=Candidatus Borkfalkia ceftriaxoniphila TaxID=2508949 RepID=A0A4Q2KDP5_9FIRM|nr:helix-turn-helix transcriptional regulator [Candidatus Borkfalkia ceftriaxoniphila]RXZ61351.1 XRE family transcriptional regulator [Candidatus Borkfalkia ceftriaxoniphila]
MITLDQVRERIIEAIQQSGLTQSELARRIGVKHQQISCYVKGQKLPALDTFANLCAALEVDPAYILCLSD